MRDRLAGNFGRLEDGGAAGTECGSSGRREGDLVTVHLRMAYGVPGVQHPNSRISLEVIDVENGDAGDGVDVHSGNQACIMDVYARYAVGDDETVPLAVDVRGVVDQRAKQTPGGIPTILPGAG